MNNQSKIIEAATRCFVEKGFHQTSMRDIAKQADVSLGNIYNHFGSKTDLVLAIAKAEMRDIEGLKSHFNNTQNNALPDIFRLIDYLLDELCQTWVGRLTLEIAAEASRNPIIDNAFSANQKQVSDLFKKMLIDGQKNAEISSDINPTQASLFILELVEGLALRDMGNGKSPTKKARQELTLIITKYLQV